MARLVSRKPEHRTLSPVLAAERPAGLDLDGLRCGDGLTGAALVLTATARAAGVTATGSSFGMNAWPINTVMSAEGLPLQPWRSNVTA